MKRNLLALIIPFLIIGTLSAQVIFEEGFESSGDLPAGWANQTQATDGGWVVGTNTTINSQGWGFEAHGNVAATNDDSCNCNKAADILTMPAMDLSAYTGLHLGFATSFGGLTYQGAMESFSVEYSTDGGTSWTELRAIAGSGANNGAWRTMLVDASPAAGQDNVMFGFNYNDGGGWTYGAAIDDVVIRVPEPIDTRLDYVTPWRFYDAGGAYNIEGEIFNVGSETITSVDVTWGDGTNDYTETVSGLSIAPLTAGTFTHPTAYNFSSPSDVNISVSIANPNGMPDADDSDNATAFLLTGVQDPPKRRWFIEELTAPGCVWCPRGAVFMDLMEETYPDEFVGVAVHGNFGGTSPMMVSDYVTPFWAFNGQAYPTMGVERTLGGQGVPGLANMLPYGEALNEVFGSRTSPAQVRLDASINKWDRVLTADIEVEWHSTFTGDYSILAIVTEDHIVGDNATYNQINGYAGGGNGAMGGFENLPNPVPFADMVYDHVLRDSPTGYEGDASVIATDITVGDVSTVTYTYTIPENQDWENMNFVVVVIDNATGAALNSVIARDVQFLTSSNDDILLDENVVKVIPNPFNDQTNIRVALQEASDVSIQVFDAMGSKIAEKNYGELNGTQNLPFIASNLTNGIYFAHVRVNDKIITKRILKN